MPHNRTAFLPSGGVYHPPLERFLPPLPTGIISAWLEARTHPGDLVIDPLGANPLLAIEAAHSGRRVMFSRHNPILWLMLEVLAAAPTPSTLQDVFNKLLLTRQGNQRLDELLESLYLTPCAECGRLIQPRGFIWESGAMQPTARFYHCPHCADRGERPLDPLDLDNLARVGAPGLHQARAFHRVMHGSDYEKESIHNALACYLPRAILVIMTLINRLDGLAVSRAEKRLLQALLLCVFDDGNSLWHWPPKSHRFLQLGVPARFLEKNLWLSLTEAVSRWGLFQTRVPVHYWPNMPAEGEGGICLYQRHLADKENLLAGGQPHAIITLFPRPNQAFWTLSALWSGWLWGRKAVSPMRSALVRRHYNWHWFAQAIHATISHITAQPNSPTVAFGLLPGLTPNHYLGMLAGMGTSHMRLQGAAARFGQELVQCEWTAARPEELRSDLDFIMVIQSFLQQRGEPCDFQTILVHCLTKLALHNGLAPHIADINEGLFRQVQEKVSAILEISQFVRHYQPTPPAISRWWLVDESGCQAPLTERVENFIRAALLEHSELERLGIEHETCAHFAGEMTPEEELVTLCLESYADRLTSDSGRFRLLPSESESTRQEDLKAMESILIQQGNALGYQVAREPGRVDWIVESGEVTLRYHLTVTAEIVPIVLQPADSPAAREIIVFPGSRSRLLEYRLRHDPRLAEALENGWGFLKFRYLRWLAARENLDRDSWGNLLGGDPPSWEPPKQMQFF